MTKQELIDQLLSLRANSEDFLDANNENDVWHKDIEAINICLDLVEKYYKEVNNED